MQIDSFKSVATWVVRLLTGSLFVFSGFVKAVDPWGTLYKVDDYLAAMSLSVWPNLEIVGVFALCAVEFLIGVFLICGCFRRSVPVLALILMIFMLPLTLWIAVNDPVPDCGCFGDALVLSNWQTFWKNVALTACVIWLVLYNKTIEHLVTPALQWIAFVASALFVVIIELFGYWSQPLIDFRVYKVGDKLISESFEPAETEFRFVYEKDGKREEFGVDDTLPDESDGWTFVERIEIPQEDSIDSDGADRNLRIWSKDGDEDETLSAIDKEGKELIVMMPDLSKVSPATTWKLNSLHDWSLKNDVDMIAIVSGSAEEIESWEDLSMASYPIYTADDTQIKEVVRGNPGVVYLEDGVVMGKSTLAAINVDDFLSPEISQDARTFSSDNLRILRNCLYIYLTVMGVLIVLSFMPRMRNVYLHHAPRKAVDTDSAHS